MSLTENRNGQMMLVNLLFLVMVIGAMIGLLPMLSELLNMAQQSDGLNCKGYYYQGNPNSTLSYNVSLQTNTLACLGLDLYLPYIVLAILVAGVTKLISGGNQPNPY